MTRLPYPTKSANQYATINLILPTRSFEIYVNGVLVKSRVSSSFAMVTPNLAPGTYKYTVEIRDSYDSSKKWTREINGIAAGKIINLDLRNLG